jgi:phosphate starvation-inducible PhoH-like protein
MVFCRSAGTGKYTGVAMAVKALKEKQVKRIILTRPAVEAGETWVSSWRYEEKLDPYMQLYMMLCEICCNEN